jgi:hypothetical protein
MIGAERYRSAPILYNVVDPKGFLTNQQHDLQGNIDNLSESLPRKPLGSIFE